jgi:hypothetical protein
LAEERMPSSPSWSPWLLVRSLLLYSVPLYGAFVAGWSWGTILALFWCENLIGGLLAVLLMMVHRLLTRKWGYKKSSINEFILGFLVSNFGVAAFLAVILCLWMADEPGAAIHLPDLVKGLKITSLLLLGGFAVDLSGLRKRSYAWARGRADNAMAWTAVMLFTIFFGTLTCAVLRAPVAFFWVFLTIKLVTEVGAAFSPRTSLAETPSWGPWLIGKITRSPLAEKTARQERETAEREAVQDELVLVAGRLVPAEPAPVRPVVPAFPAEPPARRKRSPRPNRHSSRRG